MATPQYLQDLQNKPAVQPTVAQPATPDPLDEAYKNEQNATLQTLKAPAYDPTSNIPYLQHIYESTKKAPTPLSEDGIKAARIAASLGDTFGSLAEMVGSANGARARMSNNASNTDKNYAKERDLKQLYKTEQDAYDNGLVNAKIQDYSIGRQEYNQNQAEARQFLHQAISARQANDIEYRKLVALYGDKEANRIIKQKELELDKQKIDNEAKWHAGQISVDRDKVAATNNKYNSDMNLVQKVRTMPVEWQKKMGFLKPVAVKDGVLDKTEWTFDNSIRPEVLEAAVRDYDNNKIATPPPAQNSFENSQYNIVGKNNSDPLGLLK